MEMREEFEVEPRFASTDANADDATLDGWSGRFTHQGGRIVERLAVGGTAAAPPRTLALDESESESCSLSDAFETSHRPNDINERSSGAMDWEVILREDATSRAVPDSTAPPPDSSREPIHRSTIDMTRVWATTSVIPFALCSTAVALSFLASWDCHYFHGATISFTGGSYGLWTLEDSLGHCQLWDVLFFSLALDRRLHAARCFSMTVQVLGLAILAGLTQALHYIWASRAIGMIWAVAFLVSVLLTTGLYNLWSFFFLFTYIIFVLIVRFCFVHPVRRCISRRGTKLLAVHCGICAVASLGTLIVLSSEFCQCSTLSSHALAGRDPGVACDMNDKCALGYAGGINIAASVVWVATASVIWNCGLRQPVNETDGTAGTTMPGVVSASGACGANDEFNDTPRVLFAHYPRHSITTRVVQAGGHVWNRTWWTHTFVVPYRMPQPAQPTTAQPPPDDDASKGDVERNMSDTNDTWPTATSSATETTEFMHDTRSFVQKLCCDYRVVERTRLEQCLFWSFRFALGVLIFFYVLIVIFMIGTYAENADAARSPDTSYNFITDVVCAYHADDPTLPFVTYASKAEAILANRTVAHCGACGACSNPYDIFTYVETRRTVAKLAKQCGVMAVLGTPAELTNCLEEKIGFSRPCTECWSDNMLNTAEHCLFTCLKTTLTGLAATNNVMGIGDTVWLNQCIYCDEQRSGPDFVQCSGVARRRLGIRSEIERDPEEQCRNMDVDWVNVNWKRTFPQLSLPLA